jgi:hypothetical protein
MVIVDGVDQAVGVVDATGPEAGQVLTQGFGLAEPGRVYGACRRSSH